MLRPLQARSPTHKHDPLLTNTIPYSQTRSPTYKHDPLHTNTIPGTSLVDHHGFHQYVALTMKMFSAGALSMLPIDEPNLKFPLSSAAERLCVHTKNSVEPGMYSQRSTALPRSDLKLKSGLPNVNG